MMQNNRNIRKRVNRLSKKVKKLSMIPGAPQLALLVIQDGELSLVGTETVCNALKDIGGATLNSLAEPAVRATASNDCEFVDVRGVDVEALDPDQLDPKMCRHVYSSLFRIKADGNGRQLSTQDLRRVLKAFREDCLEKIRKGYVTFNIVPSTNPIQMPGRGRKRQRESEKSVDGKTKRQKVHHSSYGSVAGKVLTCGEGDVGQLGLGEDVLERTRPALVNIPDPVVQICGGGMHTVCLTEKGEVYTFGCNDEGTLGRDTSEEGSETRPAKVDGLPKIVLVSAGDSHSAALSEDGRAFFWGNFRDANGSMGLTLNGIENKPLALLEDEVIVKIASGGDHLVLLSDKGEIFTCGCAEQGQLGRVAECFAHRGGRKGLEYILKPEHVRFGKKRFAFSDIWAGQFITLAKEKESGDIYGWGLNNYFQLGFPDMTNRFVPEKIKSFSGKSWASMSAGQHHTVAMDTDGNVYTLGRAEYGRLGLGENCTEKKEPTLVKVGGKATGIAAGQSVSFALLEYGSVHAWGMGTSKQLANGEEDDIWEPTKMAGKQLENRKVVQVSSGGQHTVLLVVDS